MSVFRADFLWSVPISSATVRHYASVLAERTGVPCRALVSREEQTVVQAELDFPSIASRSLVALTNEVCQLEFAPVPFLWVHAVQGVRELGGTIYDAVPTVAQGLTPPRWTQLSWLDRARLRLGGGPWVRIGI
ncbi:MAG: hypothetical protein JWN04_903 [Myxococcaceae bacterium]|nr:hypothetical protein [Myxococcaceae bacterium]